MTTSSALNDLLRQGDHASAQGQHEDALACYMRVIPHAPGSALVLARLALSHFDLGRYDEAAYFFQSASEAKPGEARHWHNLGMALARSNRPQEAERAWRRALANNPSNTRTWVELGKHFELDYSLWEAESCYLHALVLEPGRADCLQGLMRVKLGQGDTAAALRWNAKALRVNSRERGELFSNYLLMAHYHAPVHDKGLALLARQAANYYEPCVAPRTSRPRNGERVSIGYMSPRLGDTLTGNMLLHLLPHHDKARIVTHCYSTHRYADPVADGLRASSEHWCDVEDLSDTELATRIEDDAIDILVDLAGHCPGGRVGALTRRPAPVQISWFDYFDTMGLACYDKVLSDIVSSPDGHEARFTESVLRLPGCRLVFPAPTDRPDPGPAPVVTNGYVTFGSFNRMAKIGSPVLRAWARILKAVPNSRLVIKNSSLNDAREHHWHLDRLAAHGIVVEDVELRPFTDHEGLWADYRRVDIALDTYPFNGGITTFDALSMGVPVVACAGDGMVSRQSASILAACALHDWVAADEAAYEALAIGHARNIDALVEIRAMLPGRVANSPLCDAATFTRALEGLYYEALRMH